MNPEQHRNQQPSSSPPATTVCDLCGRPLPTTDLLWQRGELLCPDCRHEAESCGCSDDDPSE
ncbi:MAG TPA: hypothetical protein VLL73_03435 [Desulfurivibrionaceae bacterium]|nr:hypothetical protein [Desulfurivibrionaceae bacterium]